MQGGEFLHLCLKGFGGIIVGRRIVVVFRQGLHDAVPFLIVLCHRRQRERQEGDEHSGLQQRD